VSILPQNGQRIVHPPIKNLPVVGFVPHYTKL
jgi:hypothetical protein